MSQLPSHCLFFNLPFGMTVVVGGVGRSEVPPPSLGGEWSFFGFFAILLLRWSPLAIWDLRGGWQECKPVSASGQKRPSRLAE